MFKGSGTAIATPFLNNEVDEKSLRRLVDYQLANGTQAIIAVGTTGESPTVTEDEHKRITEIVLEQVGGAVPVIAGTGHNSTDESIKYSKHAKQVGADGLLIVTPYYNKPMQEGIYQHFEAIASAVDLPIIGYDIKGRSVVPIETPTKSKICENISAVVGWKEASGNVVDFLDAYKVLNDNDRIKQDVSFWSGEDETAHLLTLAGGDGSISVVANIAPRLSSDMMAASLAGDAKAANDFYNNQGYRDFSKALFQETSPSPVKEALYMQGIFGSPEARLPMIRMSEHLRKPLEGLLAQYNVAQPLS